MHGSQIRTDLKIYYKQHRYGRIVNIRKIRGSLLCGLSPLVICMIVLLMFTPAYAEKRTQTPSVSQFTLPKRRLSLTQYEKMKLIVKKATGTVSWSTSNKKVASVSRNGNVRTKKAGKCRIIARVNGKRYVCRLTVNPLAFEAAELMMVRGRQSVLALNNEQIEPIWTSTNKKVADVDDNGIIRANGIGACEISASYKSVKVSCRVKVTGVNTESLQKMYTADKENRGKILLAGSSSMDYWTSAPQDFGPYEVINMAIGGTTVIQWLNWYKNMIVRYRPSAVVLYVGSNDLANGGLISGETNASNTIRLLTLIRQFLRKVPIFYVGISPCWARKGAWQDITVSNALVENYCSEGTNMYYIDIASACALPDGTPDPALFLDDRLHPNTTGYRVWKKVVAGQVKKVLRQMQRSSKKKNE